MHLSLNKLLFLLLTLIIIGLFYTGRPKATSPTVDSSTAIDSEICAGLKDPSTLPFISYNTPEGFNECVSRCITSAMIQVCPQLPQNSNLFATRPEIKQQMFEGCTQNIKRFIINKTRCPYVKCEP